MPAQQTRRPHSPRAKDTRPPPPAAPTATVDREATLAELDELLDEIDEVLEENAYEFVVGYVQKGGE